MLVTPVLAAATIVTGAVAGLLGAMLGIGGGVFLVPFLVLVVGLPFKAAAGVSLAAVIATSSSVSATTAGRHLINLRLGMALEVATAAGGLAGGLTAQWLAPRTLELMFGVIADHRRGVGAAVERERGEAQRLRGRRHAGRTLYRSDNGAGALLSRDPAARALTFSFIAGNVSTLLGLGGGIIKVPVLATLCGVPMRVAAATSAFMIGVTATSGALIYYGHGELAPTLAAAAIHRHTGGIGRRPAARRARRNGLAAASARRRAGLRRGDDADQVASMSGDLRTLERVVGRVLAIGTMTSGTVLLVGLCSSFVWPGAPGDQPDPHRRHPDPVPDAGSARGDLVRRLHPRARMVVRAVDGHRPGAAGERLHRGVRAVNASSAACARSSRPAETVLRMCAKASRSRPYASAHAAWSFASTPAFVPRTARDRPLRARRTDRRLVAELAGEPSPSLSRAA
jgi:uncharacterized membrane protein YfcA